MQPFLSRQEPTFVIKWRMFRNQLASTQATDGLTNLRYCVLLSLTADVQTNASIWRYDCRAQRLHKDCAGKGGVFSQSHAWPRLVTCFGRWSLPVQEYGALPRDALCRTRPCLGNHPETRCTAIALHSNSALRFLHNCHITDLEEGFLGCSRYSTIRIWSGADVFVAFHLRWRYTTNSERQFTFHMSKKLKEDRIRAATWYHQWLCRDPPTQIQIPVYSWRRKR